MNQNQVTVKQESFIGSALTLKDCWAMAKVLSQSTIVPKEYQGNEANCFVALEMSQRMGASPMMVMQNLYNINGRPSWSSPFAISAANTCGKFKTPIQYHLEGEGNKMSCYAYATSKDGTLCKGTTITIQMSIDEGWMGKSGSKWKTMPEHMLRYRAAAFFVRQFAPELLMGMHTVEEAIEIEPIDVSFGSVETEIKTNANTGEVVDIPDADEKQEPKPKQEQRLEPKNEQTPQPEKVEKKTPQESQQSLFAEEKSKVNKYGF
jgi:hypothetical protein